MWPLHQAADPQVPRPARCKVRSEAREGTELCTASNLSPSVVLGTPQHVWHRIFLEMVPPGLAGQHCDSATPHFWVSQKRRKTQVGGCWRGSAAPPLDRMMKFGTVWFYRNDSRDSGIFLRGSLLVELMAWGAAEGLLSLVVLMLPSTELSAHSNEPSHCFTWPRPTPLGFRALRGAHLHYRHLCARSSCQAFAAPKFGKLEA